MYQHCLQAEPTWFEEAPLHSLELEAQQLQVEGIQSQRWDEEYFAQEQEMQMKLELEAVPIQLLEY
jgi:hypothetical protein